MGEDSWLDAAYEDANGGDVDTTREDDVTDDCEHVDTRIEEEVGTGRPFWVCEDCGVYGPA